MASDPDWWRGATIYQIYPRSFQDDNSDGLGDLKGITRRLDHVSDLGVDAIWISPFFTSPMFDMGYDVSDHRDVDPSFGTLSDFDALVSRAHRLGLKVIIDQVLSHASHRHPLFQESRLSRDTPRADWFVWADAKADGSPPNNWQSIFGGPAWEWDVRRRQYYFHQFLKEQPDLNFHNPEVRAWALDTLRFWLDRGVDGFRLDAVNHYFHDVQLRDNPPDIRPKTEPDYKTYEMQYPLYSKNRPENVSFMGEIRGLLDSFEDRALVGEIGESHHPVERLAEYTSGRRLHMAYNTALMGDDFTASHIRRQFEEMFVDGFDGWPCWAFSSHDHARHVSRWAAHGADRERLAKLCCALLLCLRGSVCIYQGEELGQTDTELSHDEIVDPEGLTFWPDKVGRDPSRTPMVWEADAANAGFSTAAETWLPVKAAQARNAVETQKGRPDSVLEFYRRMLALRRSTPALRIGDMRFEPAAEPVLVFRREDIWCAFNLGAGVKRVVPPRGATALLLSEDTVLTDDTLELQPNGFGLFDVSPDTD